MESITTQGKSIASLACSWLAVERHYFGHSQAIEALKAKQERQRNTQREIKQQISDLIGDCREKYIQSDDGFFRITKSASGVVTIRKIEIESDA